MATCQAMHNDAVKARPGREKTKMVAAQGSNKRLYLKLLSDPHSANALDLAINCPHY